MKPVVIIWTLAFGVATGALMIVVLNVESLQRSLGLSMVVAAVLGGVLAVPVAISVSKSLTGAG